MIEKHFTGKACPCCWGRLEYQDWGNLDIYVTCSKCSWSSSNLMKLEDLQKNFKDYIKKEGE